MLVVVIRASSCLPSGDGRVAQAVQQVLAILFEAPGLLAVVEPCLHELLRLHWLLVLSFLQFLSNFGPKL